METRPMKKRIRWTARETFIWIKGLQCYILIYTTSKVIYFPVILCVCETVNYDIIFKEFLDLRLRSFGSVFGLLRMPSLQFKLALNFEFYWQKMASHFEVFDKLRDLGRSLDRISSVLPSEKNTEDINKARACLQLKVLLADAKNLKVIDNTIVVKVCR